VDWPRTESTNDGFLTELFEALLDMTELDAGILQANTTDCSVARLLDRVETTFADAARKKGLRLRVVNSSAWVRSDPNLLERILLNLVSNAVRYSAHGGRRLLSSHGIRAHPGQVDPYPA
jgi:two-component system, sensor histidine kinase